MTPYPNDYVSHSGGESISLRKTMRRESPVKTGLFLYLELEST